MRLPITVLLGNLALVGAAEPATTPEAAPKAAPKTAPKPAPKTAPKAAPKTAAPEPSFNTPPEFPPGHRDRIAAMMVKEYVREGKGRPQISEIRRTQGPLGASTVFCVRYPADVRFNLTLNQRFYHPSLPDRRDKRFVIFTGHRDLFSGGKADYKASFGPGVDCETFKQWTPFPELERVAAGQKRPPR